MKALTLHQPWASLIALGVKTIETRSWRAPASLIGQPLAIHAAASAKTWDDLDAPSLMSERTTIQAVLGALGAIHTRDDGRVSWDSPWVDDEAIHIGWDIALPLGAVVATCRVAACAPIYGRSWVVTKPRPESFIAEYPDDGPLPHQRGGIWFVGQHPEAPCSVEAQRPYGDFTPGRWAWLLEDAQAIDPVRAKGRQGVWEWTPC